VTDGGVQRRSRQSIADGPAETAAFNDLTVH
jgi:hypothetical protein